jgi:hypothetical protein
MEGIRFYSDPYANDAFHKNFNVFQCAGNGYLLLSFYCVRDAVFRVEAFKRGRICRIYGYINPVGNSRFPFYDDLRV